MKNTLKKLWIVPLVFALFGGVAYATGIFPDSPFYVDNFPVGDSIVHRQGNIVFGVAHDDGTNGNPNQNFNAIGLHHETADMQMVIAEFHDKISGDMEFVFARMGRREDGVNVTVFPMGGNNDEGILIFNKLSEYPDEITVQNDSSLPVGMVYRVGTDVKIKI